MTSTTLHGVLVVLAGLVAFAIHGVTTGAWADLGAIAVLVGAVSAGVGLIKAKTGSAAE